MWQKESDSLFIPPPANVMLASGLNGLVHWTFSEMVVGRNHDYFCFLPSPLSPSWSPGQGG